MPKFAVRRAMSKEDREVVVRDGDGGGSEGDGAAGITELAHGEERERG